MRSCLLFVTDCVCVAQGIKEVEDTWSSLRFNIQKYMKGVSERGYILGSLDDVMQTLDDNAMQVQGMSASRFIGPFLNSVQNWEKSLSHIGEVLNVSLRYSIQKFIIRGFIHTISSHVYDVSVNTEGS